MYEDASALYIIHILRVKNQILINEIYGNAFNALSESWANSSYEILKVAENISKFILNLQNFAWIMNWNWGATAAGECSKRPPAHSTMLMSS